LYATISVVVIRLRVAADRVGGRPGELEHAARTARDDAIRRVSSGLAHELRNPLGVVRNAAYLLRRRLSVHGVKPDLLDMIEDEIKSADAMITALSESIRAREPECSFVDFAGLARDVLDRQAPAPGVQGSVSFAPELTAVWCDARLMQQVLELLVQNAVEAMQGKGRIEIAGWRANDSDVIEVRDSGPGIPAEIAGDAFEPLFSTRRGKSGLGLARCRQIVNRHAGRIEIVPADAGATIRLTLPRRAAVVVMPIAGALTASLPEAKLTSEKLVS
jgi:signal transduction histidine kinase